MTASGIEDRVRDVRALIIYHHRMLLAWLARGDDGALEAFLGAHDPAFQLHTCDGRDLDLLALHSELQQAGGAVPELMIEIAEVELLADDPVEVRVRFLERHRQPGSTVSRRVEATLADDRWRRVVETDA